MGKIKRAKNKNRDNSSSDIELEQNLELSSNSKENVIQTILDQLQCANVEEKYCGLQTFAIFVENPENVAEIFQNSVVRAAAPLLFDQASGVRNVASGALRNLSAGGADVCQHMIDEDIMTPLVAYFHEYAEKWTPSTKKPDNKEIDEDSDTFVQCVNLLWNLCENSETALKYLNQSRILNILVRCLDTGLFAHDIVIAVLQCLFVVSEDNVQAIDTIKKESEESLLKLLLLEGHDPTILLIKTLAAGVVLNTTSGNITSLPPETIGKFMSLLSSTLEIDHRLASHQLSSSVPLDAENRKLKYKHKKEYQILQKQIKSVTQLLDAQQTSVEILANLCSNEDGDDNYEEAGSDEEEMADDSISDGSGGSESALCTDKLPPEVIEGIQSFTLFDKVWARTILPAQNAMQILKEYDDTQNIHNKLCHLQSRSLLCVNNMLSSLALETFGGASGVYRLWVSTGQLVFRQGESAGAPDELLESATAVLRAALDRIKTSEASDNIQSLFKDLALSDIEVMLQGIKQCEAPEIRSNLIRMVGTLALLLTTPAHSSDSAAAVVSLITDFLLEQAHKEGEAWVLAEALDTVMDLYSEDDTDALAAKLKLVEKLTAFLPILKNKVRQQKKTLGEHSVVVSTVLANLPRFLKYKAGRVAQLAR